MNLIQIRCIVEIAKTGSITKASENLLMAQPNLSRSVIELEKELGQKIFNRESRGVQLTEFGKKFCQKAEKLIREYESLKDYLKDDLSVSRFSVSTIKASYTIEAFKRLIGRIEEGPLDFSFIEANTFETIENISKGKTDLGIIRYEAALDEVYASFFAGRKLKNEKLNSFHYVVTMHESNSLSRKKEVTMEELTSQIAIDPGETYTLKFPLDRTKRDDIPVQFRKQVHLSEGGTLFDMLEDNANAFFWSAPIHKETLKKYHCVQKECQAAENSVFYDVLIYKGSYELTSVDRIFIEEIRKILKGA